MQILITESLYVPSDRCEARRADKRLGMKKVERKRPGACVEVIPKEEEQRYKGGKEDWKGSWKNCAREEDGVRV